MKTAHQDQYYIRGLLANDAAIIEEIYERFVPRIVQFISSNSGDRTRAEDVIQEVLLIIYQKAKTEEFILSCPFGAFFFLLCKRKWFNELKSSSNKRVTINDEIVFDNERADEIVDELMVYEDRYKLFKQMFEKLSPACRNVLQAVFETNSMKEVAGTLDKSYAYVRKKKSLCIAKLSELMKASPKFKNLQERK